MSKNSCFFVGGIHEFTYNQSNEFSQSQVCMLIELVSQESLDRFRPIPVLASPSGVSNVVYDENKSIADYIEEGWNLRYDKVAP